jgi:hypothetical protein
VLTPASALLFWLGGQPDWKRDNNNNPILPGTSGYVATSPVRGFLGFSQNPLNPFDGGASHISPFFDIDVLRISAFDPRQTVLNGFYYWPKNADGSQRPPTSSTPSCPIVYFRAENGNYTIDGLPVTSNISSSGVVTGATNIKSQFGLVWPAFDTRLSNLSTPAITWMNPSSIQILSSGVDLKYGPIKAITGPLQFPAGGNYDSQTFDDIANFSNGTLESAMP